MLHPWHGPNQPASYAAAQCRTTGNARKCLALQICTVASLATTLNAALADVQGSNLPKGLLQPYVMHAPTPFATPSIGPLAAHHVIHCSCTSHVCCTWCVVHGLEVLACIPAAAKLDQQTVPAESDAPLCCGAIAESCQQQSVNLVGYFLPEP